MADGTTIQIEVQSNADKAAQSLEKLAASLEKVKGAVAGGLRLRGLANQLNSFASAVNNTVSDDAISRIERLAAALHQLQSVGAIRVRVPRNVERVAETVEAVQQPRESAVTNVDTTQAVSGVSRLQSLMEGLRNVAQSAGRGFSAFGSALSYIGGVAGRAVTELRPLVQAMASLGRATIKAAGAGIRGLATGISKTVHAFSSLKDRIKQTHAGVSQLWSSMKRIAMYRLMRSAIKAVTDGLKTGITNLYQYSKAMGTQFAKSMDTGSSASLKFKNSIAAMLSPAIQAAIPLLVALANAAIAAANAIQQVFAVLTGASTWYRATDAVNDYADAAKGAGGATKNLLADWDELNVIQSKGGGGGGGSMQTAFEDMFNVEEVPTNPWTEMAKKVKDAVNRGDWRGAGQAVADRINELVDALKPEEWGAKLNEFMKNGLNFAVGALQRVDFNALGAKLGAFLIQIFGSDNAVNWALIGELLRTRIMAVVNSLAGVFNTPGLFEGVGNSLATLVNSFFEIDVVALAKTIADGVNGAIIAARVFIKKVNFTGIGTNIKKFLVEIFNGGKDGIEWTAVGTALKEGLTSILSGLSELFSSDGENSGILTSIASAAANMVTGFFSFDDDQKQTVVDAINNFIKDAISGVERFFTGVPWDKIGEDVAYWIEHIDWEGIAERLWTAIGKIFAAAATLGDYIVMGIINSIGNAWNKMGISDILGKIDVFGDVDAFRQWFNTGNTNGLVMNDEGKWISQTKSTEEYIDKVTEAAKAAGKGMAEVNAAMQAGITDFSETAVDAGDTATKAVNDMYDQVMAELQGKGAILLEGMEPIIPLSVKIEPLASVSTEYIDDMYGSIYEAINNYSPDTSDLDADDYWEQVLAPLVQQTSEASGLVGSSADDVATNFYLKWRESLFSEDWEGSVEGLVNILQEYISEASPTELNAVNVTPLTNSFANAADSVEKSASRIVAAVRTINSVSMYGGGLGIGPNAIRPIAHFASGGFPTAGSMFIAGEAGPEFVGTMGGKTAVANSDQIVSGVANGVAAGQAEQNALLRTQNQLLTRMLNKEFTAKAVPGSAWGKFFQQSNEAYERQTGR